MGEKNLQEAQNPGDRENLRWKGVEDFAQEILQNMNEADFNTQ